MRSGNIITFTKGRKEPYNDPDWGLIDPNEDGVYVLKRPTKTGNPSCGVRDGVSALTSWTYAAKKPGRMAMEASIALQPTLMVPEAGWERRHEVESGAWARIRELPGYPTGLEKTLATSADYDGDRHQVAVLGDCMVGVVMRDGSFRYLQTYLQADLDADLSLTEGWKEGEMPFPEPSPDAINRRAAIMAAIADKTQIGARLQQRRWAKAVPGVSMDIAELLVSFKANAGWLDQPVAAIEDIHGFLGDKTIRGILAEIGWEAMQAERRRRQETGIVVRGSMQPVDWSRRKVFAVPEDAVRLVMCTDGFIKVPLANGRLGSCRDKGLALIEEIKHYDKIGFGVPPHDFCNAKGFIDFQGEILSQWDDMALVEMKLKPLR